MDNISSKGMMKLFDYAMIIGFALFLLPLITSVNPQNTLLKGGCWLASSVVCVIAGTATDRLSTFRLVLFVLYLLWLITMTGGSQQ
ncbi:hypothetical protein IT401_01325 [Candidatus Nomurabacteria bacterium]|nr:hypothetical protein [Candidatus Nomurabacteria bacterium]